MASSSSSSSSAPNVDLFDAYFRRADLDCDGRISGVEAVSFFQGSGLPQQILAQIWKFANKNQSGFLGREEFYNALKLVTVAQNKHELTPEIVYSALYGTAASMIPAPQINFPATVTPPPSAPVGPFPNQNYFPAVAGLRPATSSALPAYGNMAGGGPLQRPHVGGTSPTASTQEEFGFAITSSALTVAPPHGLHNHNILPLSMVLLLLIHFSEEGIFSQPPHLSPTKILLHEDFHLPFFLYLEGTRVLLGPPPLILCRAHLLLTLFSRTSMPPFRHLICTVRLDFQSDCRILRQVSPNLRPWPRMTQTDKQKYMNIFMEVDKDRDGKITREQAMDLFLSWALPREILKQVWDLSDQDNDSMLSLNEFCIALHLMERHREGHALPAVLPNNILLDLLTSGQPANLLSPLTWGNQSGVQHQQVMTGSGARHVNPTAGRPPRTAAVPPSDEGPQNKQQKSKIPVMEKHLINQLSSDEQTSINSKFQEATEADKKVIYKSRCDDRLNETTKRIYADKHEVEILAKKYEDKYKQVGDVSSKLITEEATFPDIQVRADQINSILDELVKSLNELCKKYGLRAKPTTLVELPFGWQPGIQEGAADWDEVWDKLEDKEFAPVKEYTLDVQSTIAPPKQKQPKVVNTKALDIDSPKFVASPKSDDKSEKRQTTNEQGVGNGSVFNKSDDGSAKSAPNRPFASSTIGSPHRGFVHSDIRKTSGEDSSPRNQDDAQETQSDHGGEKSVFSEERVFDEPNWGTFDTNDDIDSVWGFNASSKEFLQERELDGAGDNYFFSSGDLGHNPIKTSSPQAGDLFLKTSGFSFDDSVPSTPLFSSSSSPQRPKDWLENTFDFSRFDSFSTHDNVSLPAREAQPPVRFDSVRSSANFDHCFLAFDDSDLFGSRPFRTSLESQTPRKGSDNWSAF